MATTLSSRQFNQDNGGAKRAARNGPVFITDRGEPAYVLLSMEDYSQLTRAAEQKPGDGGVPRKTILDLLYMPGMEALADIDLDIPDRKGPSSLRIPDFD